MVSDPDYRWCLILIGLVMLVSVLFIMGQLLVDWGNGKAGGPTGSDPSTTTSDTGTQGPAHYIIKL